MTNSIIVELPFTYELVGTLPKKKSETTLRIVDGVPVRVPLVDSAEAPLLVAQEPEFPYEDAWELRMFDGRTFGRLTDLSFYFEGAVENDRTKGYLAKRKRTYEREETLRRRWEGERYTTPIDEFIAGMRAVSRSEASCHSNFFSARHIAESGDVNGGDREDALFAKIVKDGREEAEHKAGAVYEGALLVVDGIVYVEEAEPRWVLQPIYHQRWSAFVCSPQLVRADYAPKTENKDNPAAVHFRMDRLKEAFALAKAIDPGIQMPSDVTVLEEHTWMFDENRANAKSWGTRAMSYVESMAQTFMPASDPVLTAYMDLRRDLASGSSTLRDMHERLTGFVNLVRAEPSIHIQHPNYLVKISQAMLRKIEMQGYGDEEEDAPIVPSDLEGFML